MFQSRGKPLAGEIINHGWTRIKTDYWIIGLLDYWIIGLLDYWIIGLLDYWIIGLLDYWIVGLLDEARVPGNYGLKGATRFSVPVGGSPAGTGGSPVPPTGAWVSWWA
jgi:hypothetical protein